LISEALERIENHTYGLCADCDEQISEKRLAALPWAKYCIPSAVTQNRPMVVT
jgi:DnaK suppressor protein